MKQHYKCKEYKVVSHRMKGEINPKREIKFLALSRENWILITYWDKYLLRMAIDTSDYSSLIKHPFRQSHWFPLLWLYVGFYIDCIKVNKCTNQLIQLFKSFWKSHYSAECNALAFSFTFNLLWEVNIKHSFSLVSSTCTQRIKFLYMWSRGQNLGYGPSIALWDSPWVHWHPLPSATPIPDKSLAPMARVRKMGNVEAFIENGEVGVGKMWEVCIIC